MQFHCNLVRLPNFFANAARRSHFKEKKGNVQFHCNPARRNLNKKKNRNVQFHCNLVHLPNFFANAARRSHFEEKKEMCNFTATPRAAICKKKQKKQKCAISVQPGHFRSDEAILKKKRNCAISLQPGALAQFLCQRGLQSRKKRRVQFHCDLNH